MLIENTLLFKAIEMLAANADDQRGYLRKIGTFPSTDELALEFDDAYRPFIGKLNHDDLLNPIVIDLKKIDSLLDLYSDMEDKTIWLENSLDNHLWAGVREIASLVLKDIEKI
jgi:hypothetical protein